MHPCLEVEDKGGQRTHQGQYGFFALHIGGTDIFWGREALGGHGLYYVLWSSALHEGMIICRVYLSSYDTSSSPYTSFLLTGDMAWSRKRERFVPNMLQKP